MITLIAVHDFIFLFEHGIAHEFWRLRNNGSTCNRCAFTRFKTPEQPSSHKANIGQWNINARLLMWRWINYKMICCCLNLHKNVWYKTRRLLACDVNGITQPSRGLAYGYIITRANACDYVFVHQFPSLCNAIPITGSCLPVITYYIWSKTCFLIETCTTSSVLEYCFVICNDEICCAIIYIYACITISLSLLI